MIILPNPPPGGYKTIVVDPPWPCHVSWGKAADKGVQAHTQVADRYPLMSVKEITRLPMSWLTADTAHLFVWATQRFLPDALNILPWWGFRYGFTMTWHNPGGPQNIGYPMYNAEFVVYGHRGKRCGKANTPGFLDTKDFPVCFNAPRGRHSEKPAEFYELIERVTPGPRIDLFARKRHPGFDAWGDEV